MDADSYENAVANEGQRSGVLAWLGWTSLFFSLLLTFTLVKIPQGKIQGWVVGTINQQLAPSGIQLTAEEGKIALGLGLRYEMTGVRLTKVSNQKSLKFSRLEVTPSIFLPALQGKVGGSFRLEEGAGLIAGDLLKKGDDIEANLTIDGVNLGRMGILPFAADIEGTADVRGTIELNGNPLQTSSLAGKIDLSISKLTIDQQKIAGFDIPRTAVADGAVNIGIAGGKATVTTLRLGKPGGTDDLFANVTGDIKLNRSMENSDLNLKAKFGFSERYRLEKIISTIDALMGSFKAPDGTFAMVFAGPLGSAQPMPAKP